MKLDVFKIMFTGCKKNEDENEITTAEYILEQEILCYEIAKTIERHGRHKKKREKSEQFRKRLRNCNMALSTQGSAKRGCLYREVGVLDIKQGNLTCEHVVPVAQLAKAVEDKKMAFREAIFWPVALITNLSNQAIKDFKHNNNPMYPFRRYMLKDTNIQIFTYEGEIVDLETWTIQDHWNLLSKTQVFDKTLNALGFGKDWPKKNDDYNYLLSR